MYNNNAIQKQKRLLKHPKNAINLLQPSTRQSHDPFSWPQQLSFKPIFNKIHFTFPLKLPIKGF